MIKSKDMAKYTIGIPDYRWVKKATKDNNDYGANAHLCSCLEFFFSQDRKATMADAQTLRDMAEMRIEHWYNHAYVPLDMEYSHM
jgi:hypothetical protein